MAIVDRINEMTVDLGGDPTGGTIEDALNNLRKVSGGGSDRIVVETRETSTSPRNKSTEAYCNKTFAELVDMITSDGQIIDLDKALKINVSLVTSVSERSPVPGAQGKLRQRMSIFPARVYLPDDGKDFLAHYNLVKDSLPINEPLSSSTSNVPNDWQVLFHIGDYSDGCDIAYNESEHKCCVFIGSDPI